MEIVGWIAWIIVTYLAVTWAFGVRNYTKTRGSVTYTTLTQTTYFWIIAIVFLVTDFNKLHLFWVTPVLFICAMFIPAIPIIGSISSSISQLFGYIFNLGLNPKEIKEAQDRRLEAMKAHIDSSTNENKT